jgi:hypothetical protein
LANDGGSVPENSLSEKSLRAQAERNNSATDV